jgi:LPXTG-site transpeptidase (sortase) family protein
LAAATRPLPTAPITPEIPAPSPEPTSLTIQALDVAGAPIRPVGVHANGDMEIPPVDEVGWYRFGPRPGQTGSAVLAAHIAYNGTDGIFRHLAGLVRGDEVAVTSSDGTTQRFVVTDIAQYPKADLPAQLWSRAGDPQLVLITCGGEFDTSTSSYRDNVVAHARPL